MHSNQRHTERLSDMMHNKSGTVATSFSDIASTVPLSPSRPSPFRSSTFGASSASLAPYNATPSTPQSPFQQSSPVPSAATGFGAAFTANAAASSSSPFGQTAQPDTVSSPSPFAHHSNAAPSPFGTSGMTNNMDAMASALQSCNGPREMLTAFYQRTNPEKISQIDALLAKYQGNHEMMFKNLAKKYNLDPSMFGLPASAPTSAGFGQTTALGGTALGGTQGFGGMNASPFGSGQNSFGQTSAGGASFGLNSPATSITGTAGFGSTTPLGGSLFGQTSTPTVGFAAPASGGFGSTGFGSSPAPSFGSLAGGSQPSFGGAAGTSFGSPFGSGSPFGGPRK